MKNNNEFIEYWEEELLKHNDGVLKTHDFKPNKIHINGEDKLAELMNYLGSQMCYFTCQKCNVVIGIGMNHKYFWQVNANYINKGIILACDEFIIKNIIE